jgi:hypothetical protein
LSGANARPEYCSWNEARRGFAPKKTRDLSAARSQG